MADLTQVKMLDNEDNIRTVSTTCVYVPPEKEWYRRFWPPWPRERRCLKNNIHTTKYSLLTFLPKNLFEQFHRIANIYFLIVVVLNYIPAVNVVYAESAVIPLIVVLGITAIKDGIEDLRRYYSDKDVNNRKCRIYDWSVFCIYSKHTLLYICVYIIHLWINVQFYVYNSRVDCFL